MPARRTILGLAIVAILLAQGIQLVPGAAAATSECTFSGDYGECIFWCDAGTKIYMSASSDVSGDYPRTHATCGGVDEWCQGAGGCTKESLGTTTSQGQGRCYSETVRNTGRCWAEYNPPVGYECSFSGDYASCEFRCDEGQYIEITASSSVSTDYPRTRVTCGGLDFHCQQGGSCSKTMGPTTGSGLGTCVSETVRNAGSCRAFTTSTGCDVPAADLTPDNQDGDAPYYAVFGLGGTAGAGCSVSSYSLTFGDGQSESGNGVPPASSTHTYSTAGTYTAVLTVTQNDGQQDTDSATVYVTAPPPPGVANDHFANAATAVFSQSADTASATLESGEPRPCGSIGKTVWYKFTPSQRASVTVDTIDPSTNFDTVLAAYTGSSLASLTPVQCNDDQPGTTRSQIDFTAEAGTTYYIQVGGYNGASGTFAMEVRTAAIVVDLPSAPRYPAVTATGAGQLRLDWSAPASDGGGAISSYRVYGGSQYPLPLLTEVPASQPWLVESNLPVGLRFYQVSAVNSAGEGQKSADASGRAYADYLVELRAWIPHKEVLDPAFPDENGYNYFVIAPVGTCNKEASTSSTVHARYKGDQHTGFDGEYRVSSRLHFRWDGASILDADNRPNEKHFGLTENLRRYDDPRGFSETCVQAAKTATEKWSAFTTSSTSFRLDYATKNPITPEALTPPIDGWLLGSFNVMGDLVLTYQTDQFPSHAFRVVRNGVTQLTSLTTDASCLRQDQVLGDDGNTHIGEGLRASQDEGSATVTPGDAYRFERVWSKRCG